MRWFWRIVWNTAEARHINLRRFAPYVFGRMIGSKPVRVSVSGEGGEEG